MPLHEAVTGIGTPLLCNDSPALCAYPNLPKGKKGNLLKTFLEGGGGDGAEELSINFLMTVCKAREYN